MKKILSVAAFSTAALFSTAYAGVVSVGFEEFSEAEQVLAEDIDGVADIEVINNSTNNRPNPDVLIAFDTESAANNDPDLRQAIVDGSATATLGGADAADFSFMAADFSQAGNIGIISEGGPSGGVGMAGNPLFAPADDAINGVVTFLFDDPVLFESISFVDTEFVTVELLTGNVIGALTAIKIFEVSGLDTSDRVTPNRGAKIVSSFDGLFNAIRVTFRGSGALESIVVSEVPLPGGFVLLLSGLAGLGFASRFKK